MVFNGISLFSVQFIWKNTLGMNAHEYMNNFECGRTKSKS